MILYFSGTGNSEFAARRIGAALGEEPVSLFERIRGNDRTPMESDTAWVVCAPTYAWQLPHIVRDLLAETELRGSRDMYFVLTCGDGTGRADKYARSLCEEKNMAFKGLASVVMPENYIAMFNAPREERAKQIVAAALPVLDETARRIKNGEDLPPVKKNPFAGIMSAVVNKSFYSGSIKDDKFTVSSACTSCGVCEAGCPLGNIRLEEGRPVWNGRCTHCMACITGCPESAIEYGTKSIGKPRYRCPEI